MEWSKDWNFAPRVVSVQCRHLWAFLTITSHNSTITGPNDRLITSTLKMPVTPVFDQLWSSTNVCVWDVAAAHLLHEDALSRIPEESSGKPFLITGKGPAWRLRDTRAAVKVCFVHATLVMKRSNANPYHISIIHPVH